MKVAGGHVLTVIAGVNSRPPTLSDSPVYPSLCEQTYFRLTPLSTKNNKSRKNRMLSQAIYTLTQAGN